MTTNINTHRGTNLNWIAYKSGDNQFLINFINEGSAVDLSDYTFVVNITKMGSSSNLLQLTEGEGITNGGSEGTLAINLTADKISESLPGYNYWFEIAYTKDSVIAPMFQGTLTLSNKANPGDTTTSLTPTISLGEQVIEVSVSVGGKDDSISLQEFNSELTFSQDREFETVNDGGSVTFTLAESGHKNGVGIIARINEPSSVTFPDSFIKSEKSDDISSEHLNHIIMIYKEKWDGENDKVVYLITNEVAI